MDQAAGTASNRTRVLRPAATAQELAGRHAPVHLRSVAHFLVARALALAALVLISASVRAVDKNVGMWSRVKRDGRGGVKGGDGGGGEGVVADAGGLKDE